MYAIVEIAGQQFKVAKDQKVFVHRLHEEEGAKVSFDNVLLLDNDGQVQVGAPAIDGAQVSAKILRHLKGDKVIVFKKKRRKGYKKKNGHRQYLSEIQIESIVASGAKKAEKKAEQKTEKKAEQKTEKKETLKVDDLKKIEGIGPKIASTLNEAGFNTYADVAKAKSEDLSKAIEGVRGNHVTDTWPQQAQLAADGNWDELKELQDRLDGGVEK